MMNARMVEGSDGVRAAQAQKRRYWWTAGLSLLGGVGVGAIFLTSTVAPGRTSPEGAIATVIAMVLVVMLAIRFNNRATDEVSHLQTLKANSFGLYFFLLGQFCWMVLATGGLVPPPNAMVMFMATAIATLVGHAVLKVAR